MNLASPFGLIRLLRLQSYPTIAFPLLLGLALVLPLKSTALNARIGRATDAKEINADTSEAYFAFDCPPNPETFVFKLNDAAKIQQAREILATGQRKMIAGTIIKQPVYYNAPWSYHLDPKEIGFIDAGIEWCDASIKGIELDPDRALPSWCPWASRLLREIPPPDKPGSGNINPTVSMTFPYADNIYRTNAPAEVVLQANADDPDGEIVKVEFFHGVEKIGESTSYPYKVTWTNLPAANYSVFAVATDNNEATTTSKTVTFTVQAQNTSAVSVNRNNVPAGASYLLPLLSHETYGVQDRPGPTTRNTISADGRFVVFLSGAPDLLSNSTPNALLGQVYVRDLIEQKTILVSINQNGNAEGNGSCGGAMISANGRFVLFTSLASDLIANDSNAQYDVFVRDLQAQTTRLITISRDGTQTAKAPSSFPPPYLLPLSLGRGISGDGQTVIFTSYGTNLLANDTNGDMNLFARNLGTGVTYCVNVDQQGKPTGNRTPLLWSGEYDFAPIISASGRYVAFVSYGQLVDIDTVRSGPYNVEDIYLRDITTGATTLVDTNLNGTAGGNHGAGGPTISMSADGRFIAFISGSTDLVENNTCGQSNIYVRDMQGATVLASVNASGNNGGGIGGACVNSYDPLISDGGRFVAFRSAATNLVPNKTNIFDEDIFVRDLATKTTTWASINLTGNDAKRPMNTNSAVTAISWDGRFVVFSSNAHDLVVNDPSNDIKNFQRYVRDLFAGKTTPLNLNFNNQFNANAQTGAGTFSSDGRTLAFESSASDLVPNDNNNSQDVFTRPNYSGNVLDDTWFFVRQQYFDFLGREADSSGQDFWIKELTQCGIDQRCIEAKRINVSGAFFLSIEFQQTGYLVERSYKAAYGDAKGTSTLNGPHQLDVPVVRFNEFLADTQRIGQDVVVLQPGWEQKLESNKQAFFLEFVQRPRFAAAFPDSITPEQFVDRLNQNVGNVLSATDRAQAVSLFGGSTYANNKTACAQALRLVAENQTFSAAEFNRAFVLMQYFGYLRRNPDDAPEALRDYSGYDFWLTKLNQFNGNYIDAEMVKAFISSTEYRQRFIP